MAVTVNDGGVLRVLDSIMANDSGALRVLGSVTANDGGVLRELMAKKLVWTGSTTGIVETKNNGRYIRLSGTKLSSSVSTQIVLKKHQTFSMTAKVLSVGSDNYWQYAKLPIKVTNVSTGEAVYDSNGTVVTHKVELELDAGSYTINVTDGNAMIEEWEVSIEKYY